MILRVTHHERRRRKSFSLFHRYFDSAVNITYPLNYEAYRNANICEHSHENICDQFIACIEQQLPSAHVFLPQLKKPSLAMVTQLNMKTFAALIKLFSVYPSSLVTLHKILHRVIMSTFCS